MEMAIDTTRNPTWGDVVKRALEEAEREAEKRPWLKPSANDAKSWYIVRSIGKSDVHVLKMLKDLKIEFYYPQVLQMQKRPRRELSAKQRRSGVEIREPRPAPLFPKYIFTHFDMGRDGWREVFKFAGVGGMVCEGDLPVRVSDALISSIKGRENNGVVPGNEATRIVFGIGDEVRVTDGPFASFPGVVERGLDIPIEELDPEARIRVAVSIFGRATPVDLHVWQVTKS